MSPLNDKDLDRISREAADQFDVDQRPSGWEALESRLNKELPQQDDRDRKRFLFWLLFIVVLTGVGLYGLLGNNRNASSKFQSEITGTAPAGKSTRDQALGNDQQPTATDLSTDHSQKNNPQQDQPAMTDQQAGAGKLSNVDGSDRRVVPASQAPSFNPGTKKSKKDIAPDSRNMTPDFHKGVPDYGNITFSNIRKLKEPATRNDPADKDLTAALNNMDSYHIQPPASPAITLAGKSALASSIAAISDSSRSGQQEKQTARSKKPGGIPLEMGILTGPDFSNVRFSTMSKPGLNLGLQVGYRFSNRLSVNTGIIYTKKYYASKEEDFTKRGRLRYYDLDNINGSCSMLDIPINLRYDVSYNSRRRYFVSAGVSTYLMNREYYEYDYYYNGNYGKGEWANDSQSRYLFSIINLSAGFERTLNKHLSFQVEPYLKLPMKGIGYGNLQLNSYGINFSLKYRLADKATTAGRKP